MVTNGKSSLQNDNWSEDKLQSEAFKWLWNTHPTTRRLFFHVPNQGAKNKIEGVKLQAMGVVAGVPDCIMMWRGTAYGFEFKTPIGVVSPAQKLVHSTWEGHCEVFIVRSLQQFQQIVEKIVNC